MRGTSSHLDDSLGPQPTKAAHGAVRLERFSCRLAQVSRFVRLEAQTHNEPRALGV